MKRYSDAREAKAINPNDYSNVAFWAYSSDISYALSPRTLLISRKLPVSKAPNALIGFGQNAPPPAMRAFYADKKVNFIGCDQSYSDYITAMAGNKPISAHEIGLAAKALGAANTPIITEGDFTDTGLLLRSDQGDFEKYQVVHFATHGTAEQKMGCSILPPALITSIEPAKEGEDVLSDGLLSFSEIARMRFDANLVVLSACDTAAGVSGSLGRLSGQDDSSGTLDGLVRAFITARARAVLATLWNVPATSDTEKLMQSFYSNGRNLKMGVALRAAQMQLISTPSSSHPYFWGAYVLIGDGSKTMLSPKPLQVASNP